MKNITISVVIPTYNRENKIINCLESVLNQAYMPTEIIVVDDGSSDNTVDTVNTFSIGKAIPIVIFQNDHLGAQAARNVGIKAASSEYIAFQDSDDEWEPNRLEMCVSKIEENSFTCSNYYLIDDSKDKKICKLEGKSGNVYKDLLLHPFPMFQGMLVKKTALEEIGYLDENCPAYQEWDTSIRLSKNNKCIFIKEALYRYYINQNGVSTISKSKKRDYAGWKYVFEKHYDQIKEAHSYMGLAEHYKALYIRAYSAGLMHEFISCFAKYIGSKVKSMINEN